MSRITRIAGVLISISVLPLVSIAAHAGKNVEEVNAAGTFLTSRIDANADGTASSWCTTIISGRPKSESMAQCVNEDVFLGFTAECPGGLFVVDASQGIGTGNGVRTFANGRDQLFFVLQERHLCADLAGSITEGRDRGIIVGGAGRYEGATGTYDWVYTGQIRYGDPAAQPAQYFGNLSGKGKWVVALPENK